MPHDPDVQQDQEGLCYLRLVQRKLEKSGSIMGVSWEDTNSRLTLAAKDLPSPLDLGGKDRIFLLSGRRTVQGDEEGVMWTRGGTRGDIGWKGDS